MIDIEYIESSLAGAKNVLHVCDTPDVFLMHVSRETRMFHSNGNNISSRKKRTHGASIKITRLFRT